MLPALCCKRPSLMAMATLVLVLLVVVSSGMAREYTAEDFTNFPKLYHLDDYDRCLARRDGMYCLGTFDLSPAELPHPTYELVKAYSDESDRHFNRTRIDRGYCVSTRCSMVSESNASLRFERCVDYYAQASSLRASLNTLHYCRTHEYIATEHRLTSADRIFAYIVCAVVLINIIGTIYDVCAEDGPHKNEMLCAFSIPANWRRLTMIYEGGDPRLAALTPIHGTRILAMASITFAHAGFFHSLYFIQNPAVFEKEIHGKMGLFLAAGTSMIQAIMMLSCSLTCYNLLILSQKHEIALHHLPLCIIKRVIRISPVHLFIVGFAATWWTRTRSGPLISTTIGAESDICKTKFWSHVFYMNNIIDTGNLCVFPSWFLAADMHMYILACTLTLLFWRHPRAAVKLYTVLFFVSCFLIAVVAHIKDYKAFVTFIKPESLRVKFREDPSLTDFYMSSWGALPSCFMGLIFAHILFEMEERKIKLSNYKWFVYLHYITFFLMLTWSLITGDYVRKNTSPLFYAAYIALERPIYCIFGGITLMGQIHIDSPLSRFFGWRGWHALARMSLTVMLLHWCVNMSIAARPQTYVASYLDFYVDWIATNVITYAVAVPISVLVEIPIQKFFGSLFFGSITRVETSESEKKNSYQSVSPEK